MPTLWDLAEASDQAFDLRAREIYEKQVKKTIFRGFRNENREVIMLLNEGPHMSLRLYQMLRAEFLGPGSLFHIFALWNTVHPFISHPCVLKISW